MSSHWNERNRERTRENTRRYKLNNPDKVKAWKKQWKLNNPGKAAWFQLKCERRKAGAKLDWTYEEYVARIEKQGNKCAICKLPERIKGISLSIDHCHETGRVRGLLCGRCNRGIGMFKDNVKALRAAIIYLQK